MGLEAIKDKDGNVIGHAIICRSRARARCKFCNVNNREATKLCDFPVGQGRTCDAGMCWACTTSVGEDRDYCPNHKGLKPGS